MINVNIEKKVRFIVPRRLIEKTANIINKRLKLKNRNEASVVFVSDKMIQELNKKYRKKNKVTDVLSFVDGEVDGRVVYLGDIFVAVNQAKRQAKEKNIGEQKEVIILVIHGLLHLLGYDHIKNSEAEEMEALEKKILDQIN
ncbi:rRNA maturation RNase YbeY [Candidatus Falkowbacteria bacterium CG10_big_fil_rev_8_21_14_0_10_39_11]|uniref:Endoribonuclease YbeY n=1 Tax=Candidatus Falkowbacteria bacterium CG10_big_fil_rev_8_21_14_0_10_39_11 TaxID=1974565 RepID=A0A2H0V573_9BACT|nr:MAG: rRNA maturation RNase YbeY [Candidatus Falkowbacteria bacterium CG10_big_fil_rev_8_21_14_0_10_39_11]